MLVVGWLQPAVRHTPAIYSLVPIKREKAIRRQKSCGSIDTFISEVKKEQNPTLSDAKEIAHHQTDAQSVPEQRLPWKHTLVLLPSVTLHYMDYCSGNLGSTLPAVLLPILLPIPSLPTVGTVRETVAALRPCKHHSAIIKPLVCYHRGCSEENYLHLSQTLYNAEGTSYIKRDFSTSGSIFLHF